MTKLTKDWFNHIKKECRKMSIKNLVKKFNIGETSITLIRRFGTFEEMKAYNKIRAQKAKVRKVKFQEQEAKLQLDKNRIQLSRNAHKQYEYEKSIWYWIYKIVNKFRRNV